jgi:hypothetical protein
MACRPLQASESRLPFRRYELDTGEVRSLESLNLKEILQIKPEIAIPTVSQTHVLVARSEGSSAIATRAVVELVRGEAGSLNRRHGRMQGY